jgi:hypothetical protein
MDVHGGLGFPSLLTDHVYNNALLGRICVRAPYFALHNTSFDGTRFSAFGPTELPLGVEQTPMSAGDIGRHGAIAGLCCAALSQRDETRRYYLAQRAEYTGFCLGTNPAAVRFESELEYLDKRSAVAQVRARVAEQTLAEMRVSYTILTVAAFQRLFRDRAQTTPEVLPGEHYQGGLTGVLEQTPDVCRLTVESIPVSVCAGHFTGYPAMPVAALMNQLSRLAGQMVGGQPYYVAEGAVSADDLLWAGSGAVFEVRRSSPAGEINRFSCRVTSGGRVKGEMDITLALVS